MKQGGFTLLELLVAVAIFALVAGLAYAALRNAIGYDDVLAEQSQHLRDLQFAVGIIERDLRLALPRTTRNAEGRSQAAMRSRGTNLQLVRGGFANPTGQRRSELEAVGYQLDGSRLQRLRWPALDRTRSAPPAVDTLLDGVEGLRFAFLDRQGRWLPQWPNVTTELAAADENWPRAVRVSARTQRWGTIERVVALVAAPASPSPEEPSQ